jgi:hypothetical protein
MVMVFPGRKDGARYAMGPGKYQKVRKIMTKYTVSYTESVIREIDIEAETAEEAENMVMDGSADYDQSCEVDATVVSVNSVEEL